VSDLLRKSKERLETIPISPLGNQSTIPSTKQTAALGFFHGFRRHKNRTQKPDSENDTSHLLTESTRRINMSPKEHANNNKQDEDESTSRRSWEQNRVFVRTDYASDSSTGIVSNKSKSSRRKKKKKRQSSSSLLVSGNSGRTSRGRNNRSFLPPESPGGDGATTTVSNLSGESWEDETQEELLRDRSRRQVKRERPKILKKNRSSRDNRDYEDEDDHVNLDPRFEII